MSLHCNSKNLLMISEDSGCRRSQGEMQLRDAQNRRTALGHLEGSERYTAGLTGQAQSQMIGTRILV